jgi:hypothetical protein
MGSTSGHNNMRVDLSGSLSTSAIYLFPSIAQSGRSSKYYYGSSLLHCFVSRSIPIHYSNFHPEMTSTASKDANFALVGIRLGASNIAVAYFKVRYPLKIIQHFLIFLHPCLFQDGRSETVVNELGDRVTPTFITFNDSNEIVGIELVC